MLWRIGRVDWETRASCRQRERDWKFVGRNWKVAGRYGPGRISVGRWMRSGLEQGIETGKRTWKNTRRSPIDWKVLVPATLFLFLRLLPSFFLIRYSSIFAPFAHFVFVFQGKIMWINRATCVAGNVRATLLSLLKVDLPEDDASSHDTLEIPN